ncbi:hypothetical protein [Jannaschia helgolandensis]|uniref:hypothetical protein n=1 Tax=Jannaschia helgolandensis TaxID=188906 RepID=UPI0030DB5B20|tara:strand:- start:9188 stop:9478 length:291 start_codon:yes stop_codon:yes gene_type:complete
MTVTDFLPARSAKGAREPFVDLEAPGWPVRIVDVAEGQCNLDLVFDPEIGSFDPQAGGLPDIRLFQQGARGRKRTNSILTLHTCEGPRHGRGGEAR